MEAGYRYEQEGGGGEVVRRHKVRKDEGKNEGRSRKVVGGML